MNKGMYFEIEPKKKTNFKMLVAKNDTDMKAVLSSAVNEYIKCKGEVSWM